MYPSFLFYQGFGQKNCMPIHRSRSGEAVEDINGQDEIALLEERFGSVQSGRASANDRNP
jgi:hypothetical protein